MKALTILRTPRLAGLIAFVALACHAGAARGASEDSGGVGLDGKPGVRLPVDATFTDDAGAAVRLGDLVSRPLLVTFVYYSCSRQCPLVLGGLAEALGRLPLSPGVDYNVVTVSIDENDTPAQAAAAKRNYLAAVGRPFPPSAWKFLTGDRDAIRRVTDAVGLRFDRHGEHIFHPEAVIVVGPGGVVSSFLPVEADRNDARARIAFQPAQLQLALEDAGAGRIGSSRPQQILYCFPFERDPERSFYRILRIFGVVNLLALGALAAYLVLAKRLSAGKRGA